MTTNKKLIKKPAKKTLLRVKLRKGKAAKKKAKVSRIKKTLRRGSGRAKDLSPEIIFDSTVGNTDALFVSSPEPQKPAVIQPVNFVKTDPIIDEAIKEFDELQDTQKTQQETKKLDNNIAEQKLEEMISPQLEDIVSDPLSPKNASTVDGQKKKGFSWKKFFSFKNLFGK